MSDLLAKQEATKERIMEARRLSIDGFKEARETTLKVMQYVRHKPYTAEEIAQAEANAKPLLRYAILIGKLLTLLGNERSNRRDINIIADYFTNEDVAKLLNDNFKYIKEINQFDHMGVRLLADALLYPTMGWMRRYIELNSMGYLDFIYRKYDTLMVHPDKEFKNLDRSDLTYVVGDSWMTWDHIKNRYKPSEREDEEYKKWWENIEEGRDIDQILQNGEDDEYRVGDKLLVCEMEVLRETSVNLVEVPGADSYYKLTDEEIVTYEKQGYEIHFVRKDVENRVFVESTVPHIEKGCTILEKPYPFPATTLSYFPCSSFDWHSPKAKQTSWGDLLLDPSDRINKSKSQEVDMVTQKLGSLWHMDIKEKTAIKDMEEAKGNPWGIVRYNNVQRNKASRDSGSQEGGSIAAVQQSIMHDRDLLNEISKITTAMEGGAGKSAESGVLFDQKLNQSLVSTNPYYEIKSQVDENIARDFLQLVPYVYFENDRLLPVKGENNRLNYEMVNMQMGGEVLKNLRQFTARAVLDDVENIPNRLNQTFNENVAFAQMLINAGFPPENIPFMLIVKHSTIRDKQNWMEALNQAQQVMKENKLDKQATDELMLAMGLTEKRKSKSKEDKK